MAKINPGVKILWSQNIIGHRRRGTPRPAQIFKNIPTFLQEFPLSWAKANPHGLGSASSV